MMINLQNEEYEIKPVSNFSLGLKEIAGNYDLFYFFTWRDIKVKYKQTVLGFLWAVLQPFIFMIVFSVFFSKALNIPDTGIPYPVFIYSGLLLWNIFSSGLNAASNSMISNAGMIKKIYFPRLIIPMSSVLVALFDFLMALLVYFGILIYFKQSIQWLAIVYWPIAILITVIATFGLGCGLAALTIKYRDFRYIVPFCIQILMFASPVFYPTSIVSSSILQKMLILNPINGAIQLFRAGLYGFHFNWIDVFVASLMAIFLFIIGVFYFRKTEYYFADLA